MFNFLVPPQFGRLGTARNVSLCLDPCGSNPGHAHTGAPSSTLNGWPMGWSVLLFCCCSSLLISGCGGATIETGAAGAARTLSIDATSVGFGNVFLNTSASQSVTLTPVGTAPVTINSAALTGVGFTLSPAPLPVTLNPGQVLTLVVQFDSATAGAATGQLTIVSNSSTGALTVISLSGTGAPHEVELSWSAPSSAYDPIAGYHVYRAPGGTPSFQLLNSLDSTQTAYVDGAVQSGRSYDYFVESVDDFGSESVQSDVITVAIP